MRASPKVLCDEDELTYLVSSAQRDCSSSAIHQAAEYVSVVPVQISSNNIRLIEEELPFSFSGFAAEPKPTIEDSPERGAYLGKNVSIMMECTLCDDHSLYHPDKIKDHVIKDHEQDLIQRLFASRYPDTA